ncbi:hypothetical protein DOU54_20515 [Agrobacterium sp. MS2]|nr:hypothetical protein DOU54_20515 [Agrobacterium sp. MS2]
MLAIINVSLVFTRYWSGDIPDLVLPAATFRLHATRFRIIMFWEPNTLRVNWSFPAKNCTILNFGARFCDELLMVILMLFKMVTSFLRYMVIYCLAKMVTKALKRQNPAAVGLRG